MTELGSISRAEVANQSADLLPTREALALVNITNVTAINLAIAVNAATIGSTAAATALQNVVIFQH
jgi:hypothetical protein